MGLKRYCVKYKNLTAELEKIGLRHEAQQVVESYERIKYASAIKVKNGESFGILSGKKKTPIAMIVSLQEKRRKENLESLTEK